MSSSLARRAARVPFVAAVGAYADLDTALCFLATGRTFHRGRVRMVKPEPYGQLVFLRTCQEFLAAPRDRQVLEAMAGRRLRDDGTFPVSEAYRLAALARGHQQGVGCHGLDRGGNGASGGNGVCCSPILPPQRPARTQRRISGRFGVLP